MTHFNMTQPARDEQPLFIETRDLSGGVNTRMYGAVLPDTQAIVLTNIDLSIPGERSKRVGSVLIGNDLGASSILKLHNYFIQGATDQFLSYQGTTLSKWTGTGNWVTIKDDFVAPSDESQVGIVSGKESGLAPDDVVFVYIDNNNWFRIDSDGNAQDLGTTAGTGSDSPPLSPVGTWYGNRFWVLKNDILYFSDAYDDDYSSCFDTVTNAFRVPVGTERGLVATRDLGIVVMGEQAIWAIAPSATPAATDRPEPLITSWGCVSNQGWVNAGDDIYFFGQDGLRALKRTVQDKLQSGVSYPLSYALKKEYDAIAWAYKDRIVMEYFDNKIFITVPTGASTFSTWIYYPATQSFSIIDGWDVRSYGKYKVSGEERFFYGKHADGVVYRAWYGYTDEGTTTTNGTAITYTEESKFYDFGKLMLWKVGGEVEVSAKVIGQDTSISVYASIDSGSYSKLGEISLESLTAPTLPVALPFTLADDYVKREKFSLDSLGRFRVLQIKLVNDDLNTDAVIIYSTVITTFLEEYQNV